MYCHSTRAAAVIWSHAGRKSRRFGAKAGRGCVIFRSRNAHCRPRAWRDSLPLRLAFEASTVHAAGVLAGIAVTIKGCEAQLGAAQPGADHGHRLAGAL